MRPRGAVLIVLLVLVLASCAPAPTPTPAPNNPPVPVQTATPTPEASSNGRQPAAPVVNPGWRDAWDRTVAAARSEGRVVVVGSLGDAHRTAALSIERAYPDIRVEFSGAVTREYALQLLEERSPGQYRLDVLLGAAMETYGLVPAGAFDPLRPALLLPEVLDDSKWHGGFDNGWGDEGRKFVYAPLGFVVSSVLVNRDLVQESELNSLDQLLDPKWKGKIVTLDPRLGGPAAASLQALLIGKGEDFVRKLLSQDLVIKREGDLTEDFARGRYPISLGFQSHPLRLAEGLKSLLPLAPGEPGGSVLGGGGGSVMLVNQAPHPNAARLYVNWVLSRDGQNSWVQATGYNSRRLDVEGPPNTAPDPALRYVRPDKEEAILFYKRAVDIAREVLR